VHWINSIQRISAIRKPCEISLNGRKKISMGESKNEEVPVGEWTYVHAGQVIAMDTYVDGDGVMRSSGDGSVVCWHNPSCRRKAIQPHELKYDGNGAPWCPSCFRANEDKARLRKHFGDQGGQATREARRKEATQKEVRKNGT